MPVLLFLLSCYIQSKELNDLCINDLLNQRCLLSSNRISLHLVLILRRRHVSEEPRIQQLVVVDGVHEVDVRVVAEGNAVVIHHVRKLAE